jgi:uncharacterized membrane protein YtjA (UPF0391 family)
MPCEGPGAASMVGLPDDAEVDRRQQALWEFWLWFLRNQGSRCTNSLSLHHQHNIVMLQYGIIALIIAVIAGALGFFVLAGTAALIAKVLLGLFLLIWIVSLFGGKPAGT